MSKSKPNPTFLLPLILLVFGLACGLTGGEATPELPPPPVVTDAVPSVDGGETAVSPTEGAVGETDTDAVPTPTLAPTGTAEDVVTAVPTVDIDTELLYRIIHVDENDILNVRSGPGASNGIVTSLETDSGGVRIVGFGQTVGDSVWVPINVDESSGWVNSRFLTEDIAGDDFCSDAETAALLDELRDAIQERDGDHLAEISSPERGLRFRRYWRSEGVRFENQQINIVFNLTQSYFWGVADGSGEDINGSFSDIIVPLLDRNLVGSTEVGCNEILQGGTAGLVQLPFRYEGANYYSMYRPAPAGNEFDWGTWVVGIERWQERYFVSFLVHFEWEI
jgi:hypothetical protein